MTETVYEESKDGGFDISQNIKKCYLNDSEITGKVTVLKDAGNKAFEVGNYSEALKMYSEALEIDPTEYRIFGNRSATYLHLNDHEKALADAESAISLQPDWAKGYFRKAKVYGAMKQYQNAEKAYLLAARLTPNDKSLLNNAKKMRVEYNSLKSKNDGFLAKGCLYEDRENIIVEEVNEKGISKHSRLLLRKLKQKLSSNNQQQDMLNGVFSKLLIEDEFQKIIYPGLDKDKLLNAPKNFEQLLSNPVYAEELERLMPRIEAKAESVLANVKAKAAKQGEFMDSETEAILKPQVLNEAFGREVISMINRINSNVHAAVTSNPALIADPELEYATWDQLQGTVIDKLKQKNIGFAYQDDFMGQEWIPLIWSDAKRMLKSGRMDRHSQSVLNVTQLSGDISYLEQKECEEEYPAISEIIEKLQALPFELNRKGDFQLCCPFRRSNLLRNLEKGESQQKRLDGGHGDGDNGIAITCIYCLTPTFNDDNDGAVLLENKNSNTTESILTKPDRLILFRSRDVYNEVKNRSQENQFTLTFWIHGPDVQSN